MGLAPVSRRIGPSDTAPLPMASADAFGASVGRAIAGVGEGLDRLDQVHRQIEANEQSAAGAKAIGDYQVKLAEATQDARANAAAGGEGYAEAMAEWREKNGAAVLAGVTNPRVRQNLELHLDAINNDAEIADHGFVIGKRAAKTSADNDAAFDATYGAIRNAGSIDAALAASARELPAADARIDAMEGLDDDWKEAQRKRYETGAKLAVAQAGIDSDPARVKAMLASGAFAGLSPGQIEAVHNGADAAERRNAALARAQAAQALSEKRDELAAREVNLNAGVGTADDRAQLAADYAAIGDQAKAEEWRGKSAEFATVEGSRDWTLPQIDARLAQLDAVKQKSGLSAAEAREYNGLKDQRSASAARLDQPGGALLQLQYATGRALAPLDIDDPASMAARARQAKIAAAKYGRAVIEPITADELPAFKDLAAGGPAQRLQAVDALRAFGDATVIRDAAREIAGPDDGTFRIAALMPHDVSRDILRGGETLNSHPQVWNQRQATHDFDLWYGRALSFVEGSYRNDVFQAAKAFYAQRASDGGEGAYNPTQFDAAIKTILGRDAKGRGGVVHVVPNGPIVLVPAGIDGQDLLRTFARATPQDYHRASGGHVPTWADGKPVSESAFKKFLPTMVADSVYGFRAPGGRLIANEHGAPYTVALARLTAQ